jgi:hypothetical protein
MTETADRARRPPRGCTSFFRDEETRAAIGDTRVPELLDGDRPIQVLSAGCASGEKRSASPSCRGSDSASRAWDDA